MSNPTTFAFRISLIFSLFFMLLIFVMPDISTLNNKWLLLFSATAIFFLFSFMVLRHSVKNFIYDKIKVIYKTIHTFKKSSKEPKRSAIRKTTIEKVNQEVMDWEKDTRKEIEELKLLAQYRREFLGNVSHELKTPIFNIQGYVLTLLDGAVNDPQFNIPYLKRTEASINRLISIIEDLEDISNLESGTLKLHQEKTDIIDIAKEVAEQFEIKAQKRHIRIYFRKNYETPIPVICDKNKIRQVFSNLIDNSIKYGNKNGTIKISFFDMHDHILCEVTDDGNGITKENLPRLFERFYRTDKARSREKGGSGLGLAIVKHILDAHNQNINTRSKIGVGTTFAFTLKKG